MTSPLSIIRERLRLFFSISLCCCSQRKQEPAKEKDLHELEIKSFVQKYVISPSSYSQEKFDQKAFKIAVNVYAELLNAGAQLVHTSEENEIIFSHTVLTWGKDGNLQKLGLFIKEYEPFKLFCINQEIIPEDFNTNIFSEKIGTQRKDFIKLTTELLNALIDPMFLNNSDNRTAVTTFLMNNNSVITKKIVDKYEGCNGQQFKKSFKSKHDTLLGTSIVGHDHVGSHLPKYIAGKRRVYGFDTATSSMVKSKDDLTQLCVSEIRTNGDLFAHKPVEPEEIIMQDILALKLKLINLPSSISSNSVALFDSHQIKSVDPIDYNKLNALPIKSWLMLRRRLSNEPNNLKTDLRDIMLDDNVKLSENDKTLFNNNKIIIDDREFNVNSILKLLLHQYINEINAIKISRQKNISFNSIEDDFSEVKINNITNYKSTKNIIYIPDIEGEILNVLFALKVAGYKNFCVKNDDNIFMLMQLQLN